MSSVPSNNNPQRQSKATHGRSTRDPAERVEIPTSWMMSGVREGWTPTQFEDAARRASFAGKDDALRRDRVVRGYDNLISNGFVSRSDVYLSVPRSVRSFVSSVADEVGQYWAPGRRGGLHATLRHRRQEYEQIDLEVCVRFGPLESLYGDMYDNLRRYELLLWGLLRGLLTGRFGDDKDDWRSAGWWRQGLSEGDRRELGGTWVVRSDLEWPWQAATFGTMQKIIDKNGSLVASACRESDAKGLSSDVRATANVRNALMHPLSGKTLREDEFEVVAKALEDLVTRCRTAVKGGFLQPEDLPAERVLLLPLILRERLFPEDGDYDAIFSQI